MACRNHFLAEFLEVGGALTVLEVVGLREGREQAKAEGLRLLSVIAGHGRQFKELLCESFGEQTAPFFSLTLSNLSHSLLYLSVSGEGGDGVFSSLVVRRNSRIGSESSSQALHCQFPHQLHLSAK